MNNNQIQQQSKYLFRKYPLDSLDQLRTDAHQDQVISILESGIEYNVEFGLYCPVQSRLGNFLYIPAKVKNGKWGEHLLIFKDFEGLSQTVEVEIRVDSGCLIGSLFDEQTCDCRADFERFLEVIVSQPNALLVYIPSQDGRGHGHSIKNATQILMNQGQDTLSAAKQIHGSDQNNDLDKRDYQELVIILKALFGDSYHHKRFISHSNSRLKLDKLRNAGLSCINKPKGLVDLSKTATHNAEIKRGVWG